LDDLKSSPKSVEMIAMLADFYIQNNLIEQAIELLKISLGETKEFIPLYIKLIEAYLIKGKEDEARNILEKALIIDRDNEKLGDFSKRLYKEKIETVTEPELTLETEEKEGEEISKIKSILKEINEDEKILGSLLIDETGLLIAEDLKITIDVEGTSAMIAAIFSEVNDVIKKIKLGSFEYMFFDFPKGRLFSFMHSPLIFIILCSKDIEFGFPIIKGKEAFEKLKKNLGF